MCLELQLHFIASYIFWVLHHISATVCDAHHNYIVVFQTTACIVVKYERSCLYSCEYVTVITCYEACGLCFLVPTDCDLFLSLSSSAGMPLGKKGVVWEGVEIGCWKIFQCSLFFLLWQLCHVKLFWWYHEGNWSNHNNLVMQYFCLKANTEKLCRWIIET